MTKISTVIVNWNGFEDTKDCLYSLSQLKKKADIVHTIIVVDNGSSDDSVIKLKELKYEFELIESKHNLGFAGGNNLGIRHAMQEGADYIFVLNNDTEVDTKLIIDLLAVAEEDDKSGLISPKIYFAKGYEFHKERYKKSELGKVIWYAGGDIDWNNVYGSNHGVDEVDNGQFDQSRETEFATGAAVLMNTRALKKVGLFDEQYFLYLEDADLSMRMKKKGWKVLYAPRPKVWHKVSQSSGIGSNLNDYFITRNRLLFGMKYAPLRAKIALLRESVRLLITGRQWQKVGVMDYYIGNLRKGSWK
jgi:GT2 family glycosyltransferase